MIQPLHYSYLQHPNLQLSERVKEDKPSFCSRINLNWDKVILVVNTAVILAGVAFFYFFVKIPLIMIGLAGYGVVYLALSGLASRTRPTAQQLESLKAEMSQKQKTIKDLEHEKKQILLRNDVSPLKKAEIRKLDSKIKTLKETFRKLQGQVNGLKANKKALNITVQGLEARQAELRRR